ncbi:MAG: hypothetical protein FWF10_02395 [Clostridiales bacterium]|nr:hypothetical protein [Clostridiales bacterium]
MALRQCPLCEVNYLRGDERVCMVCAASKKKKNLPEENEVLLCSECGEEPALRSGELCEACWREQQRQLDLERMADKLRLAEVAAADEVESDADIFESEDAEPGPADLEDALSGGLSLEL